MARTHQIPDWWQPHIDGQIDHPVMARRGAEKAGWSQRFVGTVVPLGLSLRHSPREAAIDAIQLDCRAARRWNCPDLGLPGLSLLPATHATPVQHLAVADVAKGQAQELVPATADTANRLDPGRLHAGRGH